MCLSLTRSKQNGERKKTALDLATRPKLIATFKVLMAMHMQTRHNNTTV